MQHAVVGLALAAAPPLAPAAATAAYTVAVVAVAEAVAEAVAAEHLLQRLLLPRGLAVLVRRPCGLPRDLAARLAPCRRTAAPGLLLLVQRPQVARAQRHAHVLRIAVQAIAVHDRRASPRPAAVVAAAVPSGGGASRRRRSTVERLAVEPLAQLVELVVQPADLVVLAAHPAVERGKVAAVAVEHVPRQLAAQRGELFQLEQPRAVPVILAQLLLRMTHRGVKAHRPQCLLQLRVV